MKGKEAFLLLTFIEMKPCLGSSSLLLTMSGGIRTPRRVIALVQRTLLGKVGNISSEN